MRRNKGKLDLFTGPDEIPGGLGVKLAWSERGSVAGEEGAECSTYERYTVSFIPTILKTLWAKAAARRGRKAVTRTPIHSLNLFIWSHRILLCLKFPRVKKWEHMSKLTPFYLPEVVGFPGDEEFWGQKKLNLERKMMSLVFWMFMQEAFIWRILMGSFA